MATLPPVDDIKMTALDRAPFLVGFVGADLHYHFVNERYAEVFGMGREDIVGRHVREILGDDAFAALRDYVERAMSGEEVSYEQWVTISDGSERYFSSRYQPQFLGGEVTGFLVYGVDQTEKRRAEEAVLRSEERFRAIFDSAAVGIALAATDGEIVAANEYVLGILGYAEEEFVGRKNSQFVHPDDESIIDEAAKELLLDGKGSREVNVRYRRADGQTVWAHISFSLLRDDRQAPAHFLGVIRDVTARKAAEDALATSERMHRSLFENAAVGIARMGLDGSWLDVNDTLCRALGYSRSELLERSFQDITHPDDLEEDVRLANLLFRGEIDHYDLDKRFVRGEDGSILWGHITASIVKDDDGQPLYGVGILEDITARKQAEDALRTLNAQLEDRVEERTAELSKINVELDSFNYSVSHDLRAPIRSVDGFSQALLEDYENTLDDSGKHYLRRIRSGATRMSDMVDALLMLSRLSRGEIVFRSVDLSRLAIETGKALEQEAPSRNVKFAVAGDLRVEGDERLLKVLVHNLLENSWKFTRDRDDARVEVGSELRGDETIFFVRDNGVGFDPSFRDKLFVPFQRLHPSDQYEGQGIGLATVQRVVHKHGGSIWGESESGMGATFYFTLPTGGTQGEA